MRRLCRSSRNTPLLSALTCITILRLTMADDASAKVAMVAFRINDEPITKESIDQGVREATALAPEVCPTEESAAYNIRKTRLIRLLPVRQFLKKENVSVSEVDIEQQIAAMRTDPNPFHVSPPKSMLQVMVRRVISMDDLKLLILTDLGMSQWAKLELKRQWPAERDWAGYCQMEQSAFVEKYGKFKRLSFDLSSWPKGAKDETEALDLLHQQAVAAKQRLDRGEDFDAIMLDIKKGDKNNLPPAGLISFEALTAENATKLRALPDGGTTEPLKMMQSWEIFRKEVLTDNEIAAALKVQVLARLRDEKEKQIAAEARLEI